MRAEDQASIGAGVRVRGAVRGAEALRIEGRVDGKVQIDGVVVVAPSGVVVGEIEGQDVTVAGIVVGDVRARDRLRLEPSAQVRGALLAPRLALQTGARVDGPVQVGQIEGAAAPRPRPVVVPAPPVEEPSAPEEARPEAREPSEDGRTRVVVKKRT